MNNRIIITSLILFSLTFGSCEKNKDEVIDINQLNSTWTVVEQTVNNMQVKPYLKIMNAVNIDNGQTIWIDTIYFGNSKYVFDTGFINTCNLFTENFGSFSGLWKYNNTHNELRIQPIVILDTTWNRDTIINGHRYDGIRFIANTFEIVSLTESMLEVSSGDINIKLEKE
jgi:hypothetical protein